MSFPQFPKLPLELRLKIWSYSLPTRIIDVCAISLVATSTSPSATSPSSSRDKRLLNHTFHEERLYAKFKARPVIFHVNQESRSLALRHYDTSLRADAHWTATSSSNLNCDTCSSLNIRMPASLDKPAYAQIIPTGDWPAVVLSPVGDTLFLQDPPRMRKPDGGPVISSLEVLVRWLSPNIRKSLRCLAFPYFTWHKDRAFGSYLRGLMEFQALEELWVPLLDSSHSTIVYGEDRGEMDSHVKQVENEVISDVEKLAKENPDWKKPKIRVAKHRGILSAELEQ